MYRLIALLAFILFTASVAKATESLDVDGTWWNGLNDLEKIHVMFGATAAYRDGYEEAVFNQNDLDTRADIKAVNSASWLTMDQKIRLLRLLESANIKAVQEAQPPEFSGKPIKAYIDGMNYFYSNHPNATNIEFARVLQCIQNHPTKSCDAVATDR